MNPYRCLSDEELHLFEDEFKAFLIVNNLHAEEWLKLNQQEPAKAREIVELFSKTIFEKIIANSHFLFMKASKLIHVVKKEDQLIRGIWIKLNSFSFNDFSDLKQQDWCSEHIECFIGTKKPQDLKKEWYELMESGYQKTDESVWNHYLKLTK
ncbi:MAG: hypothetical protein FJX80_10495 [Bacteroidetes bacterium]|nr:hypothetical protein [Bacteroidota bacterium]